MASLLVGPFAGPTTAAEPESSAEHVLVELSPDTPALQSSEGVLDRWRRVPVPPGRNPREVIADLADDPGVVTATVDPVVQLDPVGPSRLDRGSVAAAPDDPFYSAQWHFPAVQLEEAWERSTGEAVVVAVVDTGISPGGEDLTCHRFVHPFNALTVSSVAEAAADDHGHGTHVAGTIAQCTNNGVGVAGAAIDTTLMPVKVLDALGRGHMSSIAAGIDWATTHGADVINLSLGRSCVEPWPTCSDGIVNDAIEAAVAEGVVLVAAAGNDATGVVGHPANHPAVTAVGAVDYDLNLAHYSTHGADMVVAPGGDTRADRNGDGTPDGVLQETFLPPDAWDYYVFQGTSMATPHVTAAVALLRSAFPDADRSEIVDSLLSSTRDLGAPGVDPEFGHGLVQMSDGIEQLAATDSSEPVWPPGARLAVTEVGGSEATVRWPYARDALGVVAYRILIDGEPGPVVDRDERSAQVTGLVLGRRHSVAVRAVDTAGNASAPLTAGVTVADDAGDRSEPPSRRKDPGSGFVDVIGSVFTEDIYRLAATGITRGCNPPRNDQYCPEQPVTRGQMAAFLTRALALPPTDDTDTFSDDNTSVFQTDIERLATTGITRGCNPPRNDQYCPEQPVTRGQMAAFLTRALAR